MSLRSKVIGTLLGVFILYALAAWLVLELVYTSAFDRLERDNASQQLTRVHKYIEAEQRTVDLLVMDWAEWDDTMEFVRGEFPAFYEENLVDSYLNQLGMDFGIIFDVNGKQIWGEVYPSEETIAPVKSLFPDNLREHPELFTPEESGDLVSGWIDTTQGPAIISSASILWSSGEGEPGGHFIAGKLLDARRMASISTTMLTPIDLLPFDHPTLSISTLSALEQVDAGQQPNAVEKHGDQIYALMPLQDIADNQLGILRVAVSADISKLGASTLMTTISTLIVAALILTLTLWVTLKGMLLVPIEHLTDILRGREDEPYTVENGRYLLSTVQRLADSRGLITKRNDEIGELIHAFDDLSLSLQKATESVWRVAHLDGLTGLANRRLFLHRLTSCIDGNDEQRSQFALLFIDLDEFKNVNDRLGHEAGDHLLKEVAQRLKSAASVNTEMIEADESSTDNIIARLGGDEFVILLTSDASAARATSIASEIVESIASPFTIQNEKCRIGACVGLAFFPDDADDLNGILSHADAAMYEAKRAGKSCWRRYVPGLIRMQNRKAS